MIIDCIADLHGEFPVLEGGDLLIIAGDLTSSDLGYQYAQFRNWLCVQKYTKKVVIAGNHDNLLAKGRWKFDPPEGFDYLCDSATEFEGLKIWGSPWTKTFPGMNPHCKAFTVDTEEELAEKWALIPDDTDILITHSPPYGVLDKITTKIQPRIDAMRHCGSSSLSTRLEQLPRPRLHVFGHIHECGGQQIKYGSSTLCINASHVNEYYEPVNKPIRVIL